MTKINKTNIFFIFIFFLIFQQNIFANNSINNSFVKAQEKIIKNRSAIRKKYQYLLNNKLSKDELMKKLGIKNIDEINQKDFFDNALKKLNSLNENLFKNNKFFTPKEISLMKSKIAKMINYIRSKKYQRLYFFYFTSESVPKSSIANFLLDVSILKKKRFNVDSRIFFIGVPNHFKDYMMSWEKYLEKDYPYPKAVVNNFTLKINPYFFEAYNIKKVPVIAAAICKDSDYLSFNDCTIKYLVRGDTSLEYFLFLISRANPKFEKMYRALLTNNFKVQKQNY